VAQGDGTCFCYLGDQTRPCSISCWDGPPPRRGLYIGFSDGREKALEGARDALAFGRRWSCGLEGFSLWNGSLL